MTFDEWFEKTKTQEPYCWQGFTYADIWEAGQKAEREACAKLCDNFYMGKRYDYAMGYDEAVDNCTKAIRERGEKK